MTVEFTRPEVEAKSAAWKMVRDACAGSEAVKAGGYLSPVNAHDESPENKARNAARLAGAVYFNATGRTLQALLGIAFGKWPEVVTPARLEYVLRDVAGSGVGIINQAQRVVSLVLQNGRAGLLAEYPNEGPATDAEDEERRGLRATVAVYPAGSIRNWRTIKRGAETLLSLVVLRENYEEWDEFVRKERVQYRVLKLGRLSGEDESVSERYVQQVWRKGAGGAWGVHEEHAPVKGDGATPWDVIPFTFVGATSNDPAPDQLPLYDLADLNIAHFRNSADHEESLFFAGQAQMYVTGVDENWSKAMQEQGVYVGSRAILALPQGGTAGILQAEAVSALAEEMKRKVELMAQLGARLIAPGEVAKTAREAGNDDKTSNSVLSIVCDNVSDAYRTVLRWVGEFMAEEGEADFSIPTEFTGVQFDAQQMAQALAAVQSGQLPMSDFWAYCRSIGLIAADKTDEEIRDELETQGGGVDLDGDDGTAGAE